MFLMGGFGAHHALSQQRRGATGGLHSDIYIHIHSWKYLPCRFNAELNAKLFLGLLLVVVINNN